jgi:hypothetical protein
VWQTRHTRHPVTAALLEAEAIATAAGVPLATDRDWTALEF